MGTSAVTFLPDGQYVAMPVNPRTWVDAAPGVLGDGLRAPLVTADASAGVLWHRQRPLFQGIQTAAQSIPTSAMTAITGLAEIIDNYSGHSDTTNTGRYYAPATRSNTTTNGDWYLASGYLPFSGTGNVGSVHIAGLRVTGGTVFEGGKIPGGVGHNIDTMAIDLVQMAGINTPDYVELMGYQNSGAALNTIVSGKSPSLTVRWVAVDQAWSGAFTPALPASPHVWTDADIWAGSASGGGKVPANTELRDLLRFLHNPPIARITSVASTQVVAPGATWTSIQFPTKGVDNYNGWAAGTNTRYTAQRAGLYLVAGLVSVAEPTTNSGYRAARLLQTLQAGGTQTYAGWTCLPQTTGTTGTAIYAIGLIRMAVGDYVETQLQHTQSGANLTVNTGANNCSRMIAVWMAK